MKKVIKHVCECGSKNIDVMSVTEEVVEVDGKQISTVDITYVCTDCGKSKIEKYFLYKLKNK